MHGNIPDLTACLERGDSIGLQDSEGNVALSYAAMGGCTDALVMLLEAADGKAFLEHQNKRGCTPLLLAADSMHLPALQKLLEYGANARAADAQHGRTALAMVCTKIWEPSEDSNVNAAQALLRNYADIEHRSRDNSTPLFLAAAHGLADTVSALLNNDKGEKKKADVNVTCGQHYLTPLLIAAANGHVRVVEHILRTSSEQVADMNVRDCNGNTALALAVLFRQREYMSVVELLLTSMCDCNVRNEMGYTALHFAAMQSSLELVKMLLRFGARPFAEADGGMLPIEVVGLPLDREETRYKGVLAGTGGAEGVFASDQMSRAVVQILRSFMSAAQLVETEGFRSILNGVSIVAVLIVTVTFLGLQTPPGGPSDGDGGLVKLAADSHVMQQAHHMAKLADNSHVMPQASHMVQLCRPALRVYFLLDGLSLFLAAADLLLVLTFLLPGVATTYRKRDQAAWVWCMLVSCSVLLAGALLCAVGAYVAAGFAVMPHEEYWIMHTVVGAGGALLLLALILFVRFILYVRPFNTLEYMIGNCHLFGHWRSNRAQCECMCTGR